MAKETKAEKVLELTKGINEADKAATDEEMTYKCPICGFEAKGPGAKDLLCPTHSAKLEPMNMGMQGAQGAQGM